MSEVTTKLNVGSLTAINQIWKFIEFPETEQGKVDKSILEFTAQRLVQKQVARIGKKPKKEFTFSMQYFEAVVLERCLRKILERLDFESYEFNVILLYTNHLKQQIL